ncbi:MAG: presqualene diphosphate synthase HpnD [Stygiobacter sp.]|uniref:Presqualene diphosphate synthase HpnD n=1 Tax=Stygiobacter electus TaxID=3032292 RepID=A0AAE3NVU4_9BACT|nr:presqualene diphosphate synthase HpnD [Stygiobacter electus]MDF1611801.1 presqualene diphosphate synthase HpnD [Stygiobacter electus]
MFDESKKITKESKSSFYYALSLLEKPKREAMNTVYAFCRKTDDIVDVGNESDDVKYERLRKWRNELEKALKGNSEIQLLNKLIIYIKQFNIPLDPFFELIAGVEMDLQRKRFLTFDDLSNYCYLVASTVGLMSIEIFGYKHQSTKDYAVNLGKAMQLTNILRDVKKDYENGRIYLPQNDLKLFNYSEEDLRNKIYNQHFINLMKYEANRAKYFYQKANESLNHDDKRSMFAARAMQHIYFRLLKKLEQENYDVINKNIKVNKFEKVSIAIGVWAKYSLVY